MSPESARNSIVERIIEARKFQQSLCEAEEGLNPQQSEEVKERLARTARGRDLTAEDVEQTVEQVLFSRDARPESSVSRPPVKEKRHFWKRVGLSLAAVSGLAVGTYTYLKNQFKLWTDIQEKLREPRPTIQISPEPRATITIRETPVPERKKDHNDGKNMDIPITETQAPVVQATPQKEVTFMSSVVVHNSESYRGISFAVPENNWVNPENGVTLADVLNDIMWRFTVVNKQRGIYSTLTPFTAAQQELLERVAQTTDVTQYINDCLGDYLALVRSEPQVILEAS
ncbi:MAG: hypothetical protein ACOX50_02240 [Patescibacteria group bacterium]|jgi:hypothetical protein